MTTNKKHSEKLLKLLHVLHSKETWKDQKEFGEIYELTFGKKLGQPDISRYYGKLGVRRIWTKHGSYDTIKKE